ncbi:transporter substrate-binding domain-containing protein [Paraburkholderia caffeinilytica]|uniref:transporter substrate-binding domain-containing protein n=1 Tax=Paraburkholderia caffeinilytica TaxID=1761016 RepID=UPI0038B96525
MNACITTVRDQLASDGVLRVGLNLANPLLVSGFSEFGGWQGVAPDLARAVAAELGVPIRFIPYDTPALLAAAADRDEWSIAMIAADPARAAAIAFTDPYSRISAHYLAPASSSMRMVTDVDCAGLRIAAFEGSAYGLWLERNIQHATLVRVASFDHAWACLECGQADVAAGLAVQLHEIEASREDFRMLRPAFMTVNQALAIAGHRPEPLVFLQHFLQKARASGLIPSLIRTHGIVGLEAIMD